MLSQQNFALICDYIIFSSCIKVSFRQVYVYNVYSFTLRDLLESLLPDSIKPFVNSGVSAYTTSHISNCSGKFLHAHNGRLSNNPHLVPVNYIGTLSSSILASIMFCAVCCGACSNLLACSTAFNAILFFTALEVWSLYVYYSLDDL